MLEDILKIVIQNPENFDVTIEDSSTIVYDKSTADRYEIEASSSEVLNQLFKALGSSSECI